MKKSELKNYIRENIISTLSEDTDAEIAKTKELTSAIKDLEVAKKEAGIEEDATPKGEDFFYDYLDIGMSYLEGFGKKHSLDDSQLEKLGKKIVDQLYKGDVGKAYDAIVKRGVMKEEETKIKLDDLQNIGYDDGEYAVSMHFNQDVIDINNELDYKYYRRGFLQGVKDSTASYKLEENEDKEPSKADLKKTKGLAKAKDELALLTREMKSLAKKYSKAEGEEKEKLVKTLKEKTKLKKELESILDKKKI
ncbi:MAG: hypothetical protein GY817_03775 [bacterium]|nr:hypothetical protein [bacterium]